MEVNNNRIAVRLLDKSVDRLYRFIGNYLRSSIKKPNIKIILLNAFEKPKLIEVIKKWGKKRISMEYSKSNSYNEILGAFLHDTKTKENYIFLFKDIIISKIKDTNVPKKFILLDVLIHELTHLWEKLLNKQLIGDKIDLYGDYITSDILSKYLKKDKNKIKEG